MQPPSRTTDSQVNFNRQLTSPLDQARYIVFDIESTGGNPEKNGITEIFAYAYEGGKIQDRFYSLVNPQVPIPPIVRRMTGIDNKMVKDAPTIDKIMPDFVKFAGDGILVSHNTTGDMKFLRYFSAQTTGFEMDNFFLCTHLLVDRLVPETPSKSLSGVAKFLHIHVADAHRAEIDAHLTLELFKILLTRLGTNHCQTVEDGIRLQGDLESGMRIGWAVRPDALDRLPPAPGLFYLYDHEHRVLLASSAINLQREIRKLQAYDQLPRAVLRTALKTYDVQFERLPNSLAAMLGECDAVRTTSQQIDTIAWHQRFVDCVYIARRVDHIALGVGPVHEGVIEAYGPVRDHRHVTDIAERIGDQLGIRLRHKELLLPLAAEDLLLQYMRKDHLRRSSLAQKIIGQLPILGAIAQWWNTRSDLSAKVEIARVNPDSGRRGINTGDPAEATLPAINAALMRNPLPTAWSPLLLETGLIAVPGAATAEWDLYCVVHSRPRKFQTVKGDWQQRLTQAGLLKRILEQLRGGDLRGRAIPLPYDDARRVNALLWWLSTNGNRNEGAFISMKDLRLLK